MKRTGPLLLILAGTLAQGACRADSFWQRRNYFSAFLFEDVRPRRVGDLVTIVISEATDVQNTDQQNLSKSNTNTGGFNFGGAAAYGIASGGGGAGGATGVGPAGSLNFTVNNTAGRQFQGSSAYNVNQQFLDHMTAKVVAVQPNGNLVIEGFRQRLVGTEVRMLRMCGEIRVIDIGPANTISSQYIANFKIYYEGKGVQTFFVQPAWLSKKINEWWPF